MIVPTLTLLLAAVRAGPVLGANVGGDLLSGASLLHRWAGGEAGLSCDVTCNGNKDKGVQPGSSWPLYQCWGAFTAHGDAALQECDKTTEMKGEDKGTYKVHTFSHCEGAFATIKHSTEDDSAGGAEALAAFSKHHNPLEGKNWTMIACEGHYFSLVKVVPVTSGGAASSAPRTPGLTEQGVALALAGGERGRKCRKARLQDAVKGGVTGHLNAAACSGTNKIFAVGEQGEDGSVYSKCSHGFAAGEATKSFARSASAQTIASAFAHAEKHFAKSGVKSAMAGALEAASDGHKGSASVDGGDLELAVSGDGGSAAGICAIAGGKLHKPPQCKATCNGNALSLSGWLPCKGELEGKCEGSKVVHGADVCYVEDTKCEGFSWPRFKMCTGLFTALTKVAGEDKEGDDFNVEKLSIANGFTRGKKVSKDGWQGSLLTGKGPSSLRLHAGRGTGRDRATVAAAAGVTAEAVNNGVAADEVLSNERV